MAKAAWPVRLEAKPGQETAVALFSQPPTIERVDLLAVKLP
jgi:hypothetical protein